MRRNIIHFSETKNFTVLAHFELGKEVIYWQVSTEHKRTDCEKYWPCRRTQIKARLLHIFPHSTVLMVQ